MKTLFFSGCKRLLHDPYARIVLFLMLAGGGILAVFGSDTVRGQTASLDETMLGLALIAALIVTVPVIVLFTQQELTDGAVRNKLTRGHSRTAVFAAQTFVSAAYCAACSVLLFAPVMIRAHDLLGRAMCAETLCMLGVMLCFLPSAAVLCTAVCLNLRDYAGAAVCIALLFAVFGSGLLVSDLLDRPAYLNDITYDGKAMIETQTENPHYIGGTLRTALKAYRAVNPVSCRLTAGSYIQDLPFIAGDKPAADEEFAQRVTQIRKETAAALPGLTCFLILTAGIGYAVFRRRDLR